MSWFIAHQTQLLTSALTLSELLAFLFPNSGGILKTFTNGLKALFPSAKDIDGQ